MKKNLFYLFALICSMSLFTACSDDDEAPDFTQAIETEMVGNYMGTLTVEMGTPMDFAQRVTLEKAGPTAVNLLLKDFTFPGIGNLGDIYLKNCELLKEGNRYTCERSEEITLKEPVGTCPMQTAIAIENGKLTVALDLVWTSAGMTEGIEISVKYNGTRLKGNESNEASIASFTFDSDIVTEQPVIDGTTITFKVKDTASPEELYLAPTIVLASDKAVVSPASGEVQDFSNGKQVPYTVTAEDGTKKVYTVSISGQHKVNAFTFDEWDATGTNVMPKDIWASGAGAAGFLGAKDLLIQEATGEGTFAAKMTSFEYPKEAYSLLPKITAGSLYTGKFNMLAALGGNRLKCTEFGVDAEKLISGKPVKFKGWYKYKSGEKFLDASEDIQGVVVPDKKDECSISAVLYEAVDAEGKEVKLTGVDINTSEYRVAVAMLEDGTEKEDFTKFEIPFEYLNGKEYSSETKYKLAIICTSSKNGDKFQGAGGSVLTVDNFEIICE